MIPASQSATATAPAVLTPNAPEGLSLAQGPAGDLTATWTAPAVDGTHSAATSFNLRSSLAGAGVWTTVSNVTSPYLLSGLPAGTAIDVQAQSANAAGTSAWSATVTLTTAASLSGPNAPSIAAVTPPLDGTASSLAVTWTAPASDGTHSAATGYNLRYSSAGAGNWTTLPGVTSPYTITSLPGAAAIDVEVQAINDVAGPGAWSASTTGTTWGATVAPGNWTAAATQVHNTGVAPNGGVNLVAVSAPTAVTGAAFAWSTSPSIVPTSNLIAAVADGQTNGWGQYFSAPATTGTFYLWSLAQGSGGATIGALVSPAITVT
jgi:hypothetical protein